jgi:hypothetical protein
MLDVETLNLFVHKTDDASRLRVAAEDPSGPSNLVEFVLDDELKTALIKLHARGPYQVLYDVPSQDVVASFIGETLYRTFITDSVPNPVSTAFDQFFLRYGKGPHRFALHLPRSMYYLPWELLRRPSDPDGLFFSLFHSVVRVDGEAGGPHDPRDIRFPPLEPTLQLLIVVASPVDKPVGDFEPPRTRDIRFAKIIPATYNKFRSFAPKNKIQPDGFIFFGHGDVEKSPPGSDRYGRLVFVEYKYLAAADYVPSAPIPVLDIVSPLSLTSALS